MVMGVISNREILTCPVAICQSFGVPFYLRCLYHVLLDQNMCTFLELLEQEKNS